MPDYVEFRMPRAQQIFSGILFLGLSPIFFMMVFFYSEAEFLNKRTTGKGGILKLLEQIIGWEAFTVLMTAIGVYFLYIALTAIRAGISRTPNVMAFREHMKFHPTVKTSPVSYDNVVSWSFGPHRSQSILTKHWFCLSFHLDQPYWSKRLLIRRKKLEFACRKEQFHSIVEFLSQHPVMGPKRIE